MPKNYKLILSNEYVNVIQYQGKTIQLSSNVDIDKYIQKIENEKYICSDSISNKKKKK